MEPLQRRCKRRLQEDYRKSAAFAVVAAAGVGNTVAGAVVDIAAAVAVGSSTGDRRECWREGVVAARSGIGVVVEEVVAAAVAKARSVPHPSQWGQPLLC